MSDSEAFWFIEAKSTASDTRIGIDDETDPLGEVLLTRLRDGWEPPNPISLRVAASGKHRGDLLPSDGAYIVVASDRFIETLSAIDASGWAAFPTRITYANGDKLAGYQLLVPTGRCADFRMKKAADDDHEYPIDPGNGWDGSDVFWREGPLFWKILATDRVRRALVDARLQRVVIEKPYT